MAQITFSVMFVRYDAQHINRGLSATTRRRAPLLRADGFIDRAGQEISRYSHAFQASDVENWQKLNLS